MRKVIIISLLLFSIFIVQGQTNKISKSIVWATLYPNNSNFDSENKLIRKVKKDGAEKEFRTEMAKIFYYKIGTVDKAAVILFSYEFELGDKGPEAIVCHVCYPEMEIATFILSGQEWTKQKFVQNWKGATGSWGEGPKLQFKKLNAVNCLVMASSYGNQGEFHDYTDYYNIETLKKVKSIIK